MMQVYIITGTRHCTICTKNKLYMSQTYIYAFQTKIAAIYMYLDFAVS